MFLGPFGLAELASYLLSLVVFIQGMQLLILKQQQLEKMPKDRVAISPYALSIANKLPYSRKFLRTINFAIFMDFTSTTKIISLKFLPGQAACLCDQIDCFTCVIT